MRRRTLIFGSMPAGASPQSHLATGPWCFAGQEMLFPGWDGISSFVPGTTGSAKAMQATGVCFPMPEDPYSNATELEKAARTANGETLRLVRLFGHAVKASGGLLHSEEYWLMVLGPFLLSAVHMLTERQKRVLDLVERYGTEALRVEIVPADTPFAFQTTQDFQKCGVQDMRFNHYVYSRIVEAVAPLTWELAFVPSLAPHQGKGAAGKTLKTRYHNLVARSLRNLPFPKTKGFTLFQALLLSLAVLGNRRGTMDAALDFSLYCDKPLAWRFPAVELIASCLPKDLGLQFSTRHLQDGNDAPLPSRTKTLPPGPLRAMSPVFSQDDRYRLRLARFREKGGRLFCVQHGANYGNLKSVGILPFEYRQHAFFSWGWSGHENMPANARPLPHPLLASLALGHKEQATPSLILVGTEMSSFSCRLKSRPQAKELLRYRANKVAFLASVAPALLQESAVPNSPLPQVLYRPYSKTPGSLEDENFVLSHIPGVRLCSGDLTRQMLSCRLLVLDHYGTTLHMALAANIPCLCFWSPESWGMEGNSEKNLDFLRTAGMLHDTPEAAAHKTLAVWADVPTWWGSGAVQNARNRWVEHYARIGDTPGRPWTCLKLTRHWARALHVC